MTPYEALEARFREVSHLQHVQAMLFWDEATMMPLGGGPARANAMATLAGVLHEKRTAPEIGDLLADADAGSTSLGPWQRANLHQMQRSWRHSTALPAKLVTESQLAASTCEQTWRGCRPKQDWATIEPLLKTVIDLNVEVAQRLGELEGLAPYDALMDSYEEGLRTDFVEAMFTDLRQFLPGFLEQVLERHVAARQRASHDQRWEPGRAELVHLGAERPERVDQRADRRNGRARGQSLCLGIRQPHP